MQILIKRNAVRAAKTNTFQTQIYHRSCYAHKCIHKPITRFCLSYCSVVCKIQKHKTWAVYLYSSSYLLTWKTSKQSAKNNNFQHFSNY